MFHCLKTSSAKVVAQSTYLSNGINILAGDDSIPVKFWLKGRMLVLYTRSAVQSALADLLVK